MKGPTAVLFARIDTGLIEWIRDLADITGKSMAGVVQELLAWCQEENIEGEALSIDLPGDR